MGGNGLQPPPPRISQGGLRAVRSFGFGAFTFPVDSHLRVIAKRGILVVGEPPLPWCASRQTALPDTQNLRYPRQLFRPIPHVRATGPAIMHSGGGQHGDTGTSSGSKTLRLGEPQRVAGIHSDTETVHKSVIALTGGAVPAGAFLRGCTQPSLLHPEVRETNRTRTL